MPQPGIVAPRAALSGRSNEENMSNPNQPTIDEFRANEGRVGGPFEGKPLLLLHHVGAKELRFADRDQNSIRAA